MIMRKSQDDSHRMSWNFIQKKPLNAIANNY
jgi:hypothetical protein